MNEPSRILTPSQLTRRSFLQRSSVATGATLLSTLPVERFAHAAGSDELKLVLVGCGGRGSRAANQALSTSHQGAGKRVSMGDVHEDRPTHPLPHLKKKHAHAGDGPEEGPVL